MTRPSLRIIQEIGYRALVVPMLGVSARHSGTASLAIAPERLLPVSKKDYCAKAWVNETRAMQVCPHVTQNINGRRSVIVDCITRQPG